MIPHWTAEDQRRGTMGLTPPRPPEDHPAHGCEMPSLAQIVPTCVENAAFVNRYYGAGITVPPYHVLALKIVALAQVAVAEYEAARRLLTVPLSQTPHWARGHFEGVAHLEMCVIVLDRLFVTAEQLEASGVMPEHARSCLPSRARRTIISKFRNGIGTPTRRSASRWPRVIPSCCTQPGAR